MTRPPAPALTAEEARTVARFDAAPVPPEVVAVQYVVWGDWLVLDTGRHNCGVGPDGHYGAHEPGCGLEPVERVSVLLEALAPVIAALPPSPAEEAMRRVDPLAFLSSLQGSRGWNAALRFLADEMGRAALASPAPAPQEPEPCPACGSRTSIHDGNAHPMVSMTAPAPQGEGELECTCGPYFDPYCPAHGDPCANIP